MLQTERLLMECCYTALQTACCKYSSANTALLTQMLLTQMLLTVLQTACCNTNAANTNAANTVQSAGAVKDYFFIKP
jgi:hypothetical protein